MSPSQERQESLVKILKENFPGDIKDATMLRRSRVDVTVAPDRMVEIATFFRDKLGFDHPSGVSAVDYNREARFEIGYYLSSVRNVRQRGMKINLQESVR